MKRQWGQFMIVGGLAAAMLLAVGCQQQVRPKKAAASSKGLQSVHFDYDRSAIKSEYKSVLESNTAWMKKHSSTEVVVEGHCDERGSTEYNIALGWRRARAAARCVRARAATCPTTRHSAGEARGSNRSPVARPAARLRSRGR